MLTSALAVAVLSASPISLPGADGKTYSLQAGSKERAVVLLFALSECPIANKSLAEFQRIGVDFQKRGFRFHVVAVDEDATGPKAREHAKSFGLTMMPLLDPKRSAARRLGVTISPEVRVLGPRGATLYRGRIDDRFVELGRQRARTRADLRVALEEIATGKRVSVPKTPVVGCVL